MLTYACGPRGPRAVPSRGGANAGERRRPAAGPSCTAAFISLHARLLDAGLRAHLGPHNNLALRLSHLRTHDRSDARTGARRPSLPPPTSSSAPLRARNERCTLRYISARTHPPPKRPLQPNGCRRRSTAVRSCAHTALRTLGRSQEDGEAPPSSQDLAIRRCKSRRPAQRTTATASDAATGTRASARRE